MSTGHALVVLLITFALYVCLQLLALYARRTGNMRKSTLATGASGAVFVFLIIFVVESRSLARVVEILAIVVLSIALLAGAINGLIVIRRRLR